MWVTQVEKMDGWISVDHWITLIYCDPVVGGSGQTSHRLQHRLCTFMARGSLPAASLRSLWDPLQLIVVPPGLMPWASTCVWVMWSASENNPQSKDGIGQP